MMDIEETGVEFWTGLVFIRIGPMGWCYEHTRSNEPCKVMKSFKQCVDCRCKR